MEYTIYLDAMLLLAAFLTAVHSLTLWAVGRILRIGTTTPRVLLAAAIGTLSDCGVLIFDLVYGGSWPTRLLEALLTLGVLAWACRFTLIKASRGQILRAIGHVYLFTIVSAGASMTAYYMTGENAWAARVVSVLSLFILIEAGWGLVQERLVPRSLFADVRIVVEGKEVVVRALVDTGHSLRDPFSRSCVVIMEAGALGGIIPEDVLPVFMGTEDEALSLSGGIPTGSPWASRLRILPYSSLGMEDGLMMGFRPDFVGVDQGNGENGLEGAIVGVSPKSLSRDGSYNALIPPEAVGSENPQPGAGVVFSTR